MGVGCSPTGAWLQKPRVGERLDLCSPQPNQQPPHAHTPGRPLSGPGSPPGRGRVRRVLATDGGVRGRGGFHWPLRCRPCLARVQSLRMYRAWSGEKCARLSQGAGQNQKEGS